MRDKREFKLEPYDLKFLFEQTKLSDMDAAIVEGEFAEALYEYQKQVDEYYKKLHNPTVMVYRDVKFVIPDIDEAMF